MIALYRLDQNPVTFDAATFFAVADAARRLLKHDDMTVVFQYGPGDGFRQQSPRDLSTPLHRKQARLWNVLVPMARLVPNVRAIHVCGAASADVLMTATPGANFIFPGPNAGAQYMLPRALLAYQEAGDIRCFEASQTAREFVAARLGGKPFIAVTERRSDVDPVRNSNFPEWERACDALRAQGHMIVHVDDTEAPGDLGPALGMRFPAAAHNLDIRMALYEAARLNLFVSNGPAALSYYSRNTRHLIFKMHVEGSQFATPEFLAKAHGLTAGTQMPWCSPEQRIVWAPDDAERILEAVAEAMEAA